MASRTPRLEVWSGEHLPRWPDGAVRAILETGHVTEATRRALRARLERQVPVRPLCLLEDAFLTLSAVCARLIPQPERGEDAVDLAAAIDMKLAGGKGNGWRYASMPPDREAYRRGLHGIDETAWEMFGAPFRILDPARQDAILAAIQAGDPPGAIWAGLPADRFFEELLTDAVESYYAHPWAQEEIGYLGMADTEGWRAIGLNEREPREPAPLPHGTQPEVRDPAIVEAAAK